MKIGCGTEVFREFPLDRALDAIRQAGYEYFETQAIAPWCPHVDIRRDDPISFADNAKKLGFKGVTALWMPDGSLLTSEKSVESGKIALEWAAAAGIGVVNTGDGFKPDGMTDGSAYTLLRRRLEALLETAERVGVYIAIEPHGSYSLSSAGLVKLMSLVDSPWLGINFDPANIYRARIGENKSPAQEVRAAHERADKAEKEERAEDELDILDKIADRVVHFHAKDMDDNGVCTALGDGEVKLAECIKLLGRYDYCGAVSLETEGGDNFDDCLEIAKGGFEFLSRL